LSKTEKETIEKGIANATGDLCDRIEPTEQIQGGWSATINVSKGGQQEQTQAAISYPCKIGKLEEPKVVYLNEKQIAEGGLEAECEGSGNVPLAEEGFLCIYQSATSEKGSQETEWKEAKFFATEDLEGNLNSITPNVVGTKPSKSKIGELVVFRTTTFEAGVGAALTIPANATLNADGSWAFRELRPGNET
jgi:hypothetical protein